MRAIQTDAAAFLPDDWLECLLLALPEKEVVPQVTALQLAFERACQRWGLDARLRPNGAIERAIESAVASALSRGLLIRVGAGGLQRLTAESPAPEPPQGAFVANASEARFISGWVRVNAGLDPLRRFVLLRRSGEHAPREALASVATRLGLTLERATQMELEAWQRVSVSLGWARALRARLERAFAGAAALPVRRLLSDDAWWQGLDGRLELADAVFEGLLEARVHRVELALPEREVFIARFSQAELDATLSGLMDVAARLRTPSAIDAYHRLADAAARELDASLATPFRAALEACLELDPGDSTKVIGFDRRLPQPLPAAGEPPAGEHVFDGRDVPGGPEAIARVLNDVTDALAASQRPLDVEQTWALVPVPLQQTWSPELMLQIFGADPALRVSATHATSLRRWQLDATTPTVARLGAGMPPSARPRLEALMQQPPPAPETLARQLAAELERLDRGTDFEDLEAPSMARELADLCLRWLDQAANEPPDVRAVMLAAVQMVRDAMAPDEQDPDAPLLDREALAGARDVLGAALRWRGLDWV